MGGGKQILIIDDDATLVELLADQLLLHEELITSSVLTGAASLGIAKKDYFDVIILDVGLPDIDGREVCRLLRCNGVTSPIIMLIYPDTDVDTILGLDAGSSDYITKPFRLGVLLARLRAHIRQNERSDDVIFTIGPYNFQPANKLLVNIVNDEKVRLTDKETAILKYLYLAGDQTVSRDTLLDEVWGYNASVTTHTLETHVYRLRQKFEPDPSNAGILVTEPGGYRLVPKAACVPFS
jgi:DNA-binding response OmpR family regulator